MLEGGEDARFIARRMVILASEDIGNADPQALVVATAAGAAVDRVGLPEARLNLAQACVYLALAPKSNASYVALQKAVAHIREHGAAGPPDHLRDGHYAGAAKLGRGVGYQYPHDLPGGVSEQPLGPESVRGERFYEPTDRGFEGRARRAARPPPQRLSRRADVSVPGLLGHMIATADGQPAIFQSRDGRADRIGRDDRSRSDAGSRR